MRNLTLCLLGFLLFSDCAGISAQSLRVTVPGSKPAAERNTGSSAESGKAPVESPATSKPGDSASLSAIQEKLLASARKSLGTFSSQYVNGKSYPADCTGSILAIYARAGFALDKEFAAYTGGGVTRLYKSMTAKKLLTETPSIGDIIFWDNTYDRDEDGRIDDELTHLGMVYDVSKDGVVTYIHYDYQRGVVLAYMDLKNPAVYRTKSGQTLNTPIRIGGNARDGKPWLSGQLFRGYGQSWKLFD